MPNTRPGRVAATMILLLCGFFLTGCARESNSENSSHPTLSIERSDSGEKVIGGKENVDQLPKASPEENQKLANEIATLLRESKISGYDIAIMVKDGVVELTGTVPSKAARQRAIEAVESHPGVKSLDCQLKIQAREAE